MSVLTNFSGYMPHGMCLLWEPWLIVLWAGSDLLIVVAYFAIPFAMFRVLLKRDDIRHRGLIGLFASFILLCGITHALAVVTLWWPIYPVQGVVKLATGLVSAATAIVLFRLVPTLVAIPGMKDLENANRELTEEVAAHRRTLTELNQARRELEAKVDQRTAELRQANTRLAVTAREAVHRSRNLIAVVSAMVRQSARTKSSTADFTDALIGRLNALAEATAAVVQGTDRPVADLEAVVRKQLEPVTLTYPDRVEVAGQGVAIGAEAAQQISLAVHELATNAQKYGSLNASDAKIALSWTVQDSPDDGPQLELTWEEDLPLAREVRVIAPAEPGFGTRLLTQIIPSMLNGKASRTLNAEGLVYRLHVPLSAIVPDESRSGSEAFAVGIVDTDFGAA